MISARLTKLRERQGISQKTLAKKLGLGIGTIGGYENGTRTPKRENIAKLAQYFRISEEDLMYGKPLNRKQREALTQRLDEPLSCLSADEQEIMGINAKDILNALKSAKVIREDKAEELAKIAGTDIRDILDAPYYTQDTSDEYFERAAQNIFDKHRALFNALDDATPEEVRKVSEYLDFLKTQR